MSKYAKSIYGGILTAAAVALAYLFGQDGVSTTELVVILVILGIGTHLISNSLAKEVVKSAGKVLPWAKK